MQQVTQWLQLLGLVTMVGAAGCASSTQEKERALAHLSYDLGVASFGRGDMRGALADLLKAVQKDPNLVQAHQALGLVYHSMGRREEALQHYRRALALNPKSSETYNNMGTLLIDLGRYEEAIEAFKIALGDILYATPSLAEGNMGWAYYKAGNKEAGLQHLRNAVATNPKFCRGYEWLMRIGLDTRDAALAVSQGRRFNKYCATDKDIVASVSPDYLREMQYYLGVAYIASGDQKAARDTFAQCAVGDTELGFAAKCAQSLQGLH